MLGPYYSTISREKLLALEGGSLPGIRTTNNHYSGAHWKATGGGQAICVDSNGHTIPPMYCHGPLPSTVLNFTCPPGQIRLPYHAMGYPIGYYCKSREAVVQDVKFLIAASQADKLSGRWKNVPQQCVAQKNGKTVCYPVTPKPPETDPARIVEAFIRDNQIGPTDAAYIRSQVLGTLAPLPSGGGGTVHPTSQPDTAQSLILRALERLTADLEKVKEPSVVVMPNQAATPVSPTLSSINWDSVVKGVLIGVGIVILLKSLK